jgi:hypothetical protein
MWRGPVRRQRALTHSGGIEWQWCWELLNHNCDVIIIMWCE